MTVSTGENRDNGSPLRESRGVAGYAVTKFTDLGSSLRSKAAWRKPSLPPVAPQPLRKVRRL